MTARLWGFGWPRVPSTARPAAALAVTVLTAALVAIPAPATAAPSQIDPAVIVAPTLPNEEPPDPVLDDLAVDETSATRRADERYGEARRAEEAATAGWLTAERDRLAAVDRATTAAVGVLQAQAALDDASAQVERQTAVWRARQVVTDRRQAALAVEQRQLRTVAAAVFSSAPADQFMGLGTFEEMSRGNRRDAIRDRVVAVQTGIVDGKSASWRAARALSDAEARTLRRDRRARQDRAARLGRANAASHRATDALAVAQAVADDRHRDTDRATDKRLAARDDRREARLLARVPDTDMTLVDVAAYWQAAKTSPCQIPWWVLAGVGRVESGHGTAQGSSVKADGDTTVAILGIPLDGRPGTAAIHDSDGGRLDHDPLWDRAVGPMQFLPGTWNYFSNDANADGVSNPHNLYDAAGAAARLLCLGRGDLLTEADFHGALLSYNNSIPYGNQVLGYAHRYQAAVDLPDVPPEDPVDPEAQPAN